MHGYLKSAFPLLGCCLLLLSPPVSAQETGGSEGNSSGYSGGNSSGGGTTTGRSPATRISTVPQVVTRLGQMQALCVGSGAYVVDCLAERIEAIEADASNMAGYNEMHQILQQAAKELRVLARNNRDPLQPRAKLSSKDGQLSSRPLVAVAPSRRRAAQTQAVKILQEAETKLLRSSTQSVERANQYRQVAQALGSNKVLLRS